MLRGNLSTRPFYNTRAVRGTLWVLAAIVLAITLFNIIQIVRLVARQQTLGASASQAEDEAVRLRSEAARISAQIDPKELQVVAGEAREANAIIERRAFSWTNLWEYLEATLPEDVRITAVRPRLERDERFVVDIGVQARSVEDLQTFLDSLEKTKAFRNVLSIEEQTNDEGLIEAIVEGLYVQPAREATDAARPAEQGAARD